MSSEGTLMTEKEKLEAQKRMSGDEVNKLHELLQKQGEAWGNEKRDLQEKIHDLVVHNDRVKDEFMKKVIAYKDKYIDYKSKVKQANQQISTLMQRVARFEIEQAQ